MLKLDRRHRCRHDRLARRREGPGRSRHGRWGAASGPGRRPGRHHPGPAGFVNGIGAIIPGASSLEPSAASCVGLKFQVRLRRLARRRGCPTSSAASSARSRSGFPRPPTRSTRTVITNVAKTGGVRRPVSTAANLEQLGRQAVAVVAVLAYSGIGDADHRLPDQDHRRPAGDRGAGDRGSRHGTARPRPRTSRVPGLGRFAAQHRRLVSVHNGMAEADV